MATWKKVIVSGSAAELLNVTSSAVLVNTSLNVGTNQQITTLQATTFLTGSFTGSFTGALTGTASFATSATSASFASTASFALNVVNQVSTASLLTTASFSNPNLTFTKGDGSTFNQSLVTLVPTSASFASTSALAATVTTNANLTGDVTSVGNATTLASVASAGTTGGSTAIPVITINAKGLTTGITTAAVIAPAGTLTGATLASNVLTSSLTSVGTLAGLTVTGSLIAPAITGSLQGTASWASNAVTASYALNTNADLAVSGSTGNGSIDLMTQAFNILGTANEVETNMSSQTLTIGLPDNVTLTGDLTLGGNDIKASDGTTAITTTPTLGDVTIAGDLQINGNDIKSSTGGTVFTLSGANVTAPGNLTVTGDLTVAGTASFTNVDNLTIKDKFILINSGSTTLADSGWVTQYNAAGSGSAFYLEAGSTGTYGRFAVAYDVIGTSTALTVDEFVVSAKTSAVAPTAAPTWGGSSNGNGNIHVDSVTGNIFIYS